MDKMASASTEHPNTTGLAQRYAALIVRRAQALLIAPLILCVLLTPLAFSAVDHTVPDGWLPHGSDAMKMQAIAAEEFGRSGANYYLLFSDPTGQRLADSPEFVSEVQHAVRPFRAMPEVADVFTWGTTRSDLLNTILISDDRTMSIAVISLAGEPTGTIGTPDWLRANLDTHSLHMQLTGLPVVGDDFRSVGENDLFRAELISLPVTLILLLIIFRGVIPALVPVMLAVCGMIITLATMNMVSRVSIVNVFTVNTVTMLGLATGIDYALIMVSRFREEIQYHPAEIALARTLSTAGRTVIVAGSTVAIGLSGLFFFRVPAATTTALLGATIVVVTVLLALTALSATLFLLARFFRTPSRPMPSRRLLTSLESWRERHPVSTVLICIALLAVLTAPILSLRGVSPGINNLPPGVESRAAAETIRDHFPAASTSPIEIVLQPRRGSMLDAGNLGSYQQIATMLRDIDGVQRVESLWSFAPAGFTPGTLATSFILQPELVRVSRPFITRNAALLIVTADASLDHDGQIRLVNTIRSQLHGEPAPNMRAIVGGQIGLDIDMLEFVKNRIPIVLTWIVLLTALALFAQLRSALLPMKAIALNLASIGASFGALVWIFQEGHLSSVLRFEPQGTTVLLVPVLMFCFLFGLSMDYEVIMLGRIREQWLSHGETNAAVNTGLERSAGIVTASAALMITVFVAFAFSQLDVVKALGVGLAIAVALDATVVRLLLLPATMQLMGSWNWWPTKRS